MDARLLGKYGEERIASYLRENGYSILAMNYHSRFGEIDIIASDRSFVAFVEVKLRKNSAFSPARAAVTVSKQKKIIFTSRLWLQSHPTGKQPRFDVAEVYVPNGPGGTGEQVVYLKNAFSAD